MSERTIETLATDVDKSHKGSHRPSFWYRMRPSEIGDECSRYLWLSFRWASLPKAPPGRIARIFSRGNREEENIIDDVQKTGITVMVRDPCTGKQYAVVAARGHMYGLVDGVAFDGSMKYLRRREWAILEAKSHNEKNFRALNKHGLKKTAPKHWAQLQLYMHMLQAKLALYAARNKNDETDLFIEVDYDADGAQMHLERVERIAFSPAAPERISSDPDYYKCSFCNHRDTCLGDTLPLRNCRTCRFSAPIDDGKWLCQRRQEEVDRVTQMRGCELHRWIPTILNAERTNNVSEDIGRYKMRTDGRNLEDAGPE